MIGQRLFTRTKYLLSIAIVLLLMSVAMGYWSTASAQQSVPTINLGFEPSVVAGENILVSAYLTDPAGSPIYDVEIRFTFDSEFMNVSAPIDIGSAITDETGLALVLFEPRAEGAINVTATFAGTEVFTAATESKTLEVLPGKQIYRELPPYRIPGANVWLITGLISTVWIIFIFSLGFVGWANVKARRDRAAADAYPRGLRGYPGIVGPFIGVVILITSVSVLLVQTTLRPWATPDYSFETHLNTSNDLDGYTRTELTYLGEISDGPVGWSPSKFAKSTSNQGYAAYVGYGCAACHGNDGGGTPAGPSVTGGSVRRIENLTRSGPKSMPAFGELHLVGADLALIATFLSGQTEATVTPEPFVRLTATPFPFPTAIPEPSVTPTPTAVPVDTPVPGAPTPTPEPPTPTPTVVPTQVPVDAVRLEAAQRLFFDVGCDICHGELAEGDEGGPVIEDLTAEEISNSVRDPLRPADSKFSEAMDPYDLMTLSESELDELIYFLLNRIYE